MMRKLLLGLCLVAPSAVMAQQVAGAIDKAPTKDETFYYVDRNDDSFTLDLVADTAVGDLRVSVRLLSPDVPEWSPIGEDRIPEVLIEQIITESGPFSIEVPLLPGEVAENEAALAFIRVDYNLASEAQGSFPLRYFIAIVNDVDATTAEGTSFGFGTPDPRNLFLCQANEVRDFNIGVRRVGNSNYATIVPITAAGNSTAANANPDRSQLSVGGEVRLNDDPDILFPSLGFVPFAPTQTEAQAPAVADCGALPRQDEDLPFGASSEGEIHFGSAARAPVPLNVQPGIDNSTFQISFQNGLPGMEPSPTPMPTPVATPTPMPTPPPMAEDPELCLGTIQSSDARVCVSRKTVSAIESAESVELNFRRRGDVDAQVLFDYRLIPGTAQQDMDYEARSGTISLGAGQTMATVFVPLIDNDEIDGDRTLQVEVLNPVNAVIVPGFERATITILDDDVEAGLSTLSFGADRGATGEDDGPITVTVLRSGNTTGVASVSYSFQNQSALLGRDYQATPGTLNWGAGDTQSKPIPIDIIDNDDVDGDKSFLINLTNPVGAELTPFASIQAIITDDDVANADSEVRLAMSEVTVNEGTGTLSIEIGRFGDTRGAARVSVRAVSTGSATPAVHFSQREATFAWAPGDGSPRQFVVPILDNQTDDGTRTFRVELFNAEGMVIGAPGATLVTILDNDGAAPVSQVNFLQTGVSVSEANGELRLSVARTGNAAQAGSIQFGTLPSGTAIAGRDYDETSGQLNWAAGDSGTRQIIVPLINNSGVDGSRVFQVRLSNPVGLSLGDSRTATVTIIDDDTVAAQPGRIGVISPTEVVVQREAGVARITIERAGATAGAASVMVGLIDGSAISGEDFDATGFPLTLNWASGENGTRTVTVPLVTGAALFGVPERQFTITLEGAQGASLASANESVTVSIVSRQLIIDTSVGGGSAGSALLLILGAMAMLRRRALRQGK